MLFQIYGETAVIDLDLFDLDDWLIRLNWYLWV